MAPNILYSHIVELHVPAHWEKHILSDVNRCKTNVKDVDRHYIHFETTISLHVPSYLCMCHPLNLLKPIKLPYPSLTAPYHPPLPPVTSCPLPVPYTSLNRLASLGLIWSPCRSPLSPVLSLSSLSWLCLVTVLSLMLPLPPPWNLELDPEALGLVVVSYSYILGLLVTVCMAHSVCPLSH